MTTDAGSALCQRMIEDMNSRKLGAHTQRARSTAAALTQHIDLEPLCVPKTSSGLI
jgi:hypothetical protein